MSTLGPNRMVPHLCIMLFYFYAFISLLFYHEAQLSISLYFKILLFSRGVLGLWLSPPDTMLNG